MAALIKDNITMLDFAIQQNLWREAALYVHTIVDNLIKLTLARSEKQANSLDYVELTENKDFTYVLALIAYQVHEWTPDFCYSERFDLNSAEIKLMVDKVKEYIKDNELKYKLNEIDDCNTVIKIEVNCEKNDPVDIRCGGPKFLGFDFFTKKIDASDAIEFIREQLNKNSLPLINIDIQSASEDATIWTKEKIAECIKNGY